MVLELNCRLPHAKWWGSYALSVNQKDKKVTARWYIFEGLPQCYHSHKLLQLFVHQMDWTVKETNVPTILINEHANLLTVCVVKYM